MDESAKQIFKMKFAKLTMVLNAIFFLAALSILATFLEITSYSHYIAVIFGVSAILLALYFRKAYMNDKKWLMAQDDTSGKPAKETEISVTAGEQTGDIDA